MDNLLRLLPYEHTRSFLFRIHYQSPFGTFASTARRFGFDKFKATPITALHKLDANLHSLISSNPINDWKNNGDGNYILPFATESEKEKIAAFFEGQLLNFSTIHSRTLHNKLWRYCPLCREEDIDVYGIPYYHQPHQLAGVFHCYKHGCELINECSRCDYKLFDLDRAPIPPVECPACGSTMRADDAYFDDLMHNIESFCLRLNNRSPTFSLNDIQQRNLEYLGISETDINTLAFKQRVSEWNKELWLFVGKERLQRYFNNTRESKGIIMSPTLRTSRHFSKNSSTKYSPPLIFILSMHATNTLLPR